MKRDLRKRAAKSHCRLLLLSASVLVALSGCQRAGTNEGRQQANHQLLEYLRSSVDLNGAATPDLEVGETSPLLSGESFSGDWISMDEHKGKVIFLAFLSES